MVQDLLRPIGVTMAYVEWCARRKEEHVRVVVAVMTVIAVVAVRWRG